MKIKKGDYFDYYQDGQPVKRLVCYSPIYNEHYCHAVDINDLDSAGYLNKVYIVDFENEVETVLGNIFE